LHIISVAVNSRVTHCHYFHLFIKYLVSQAQFFIVGISVVNVSKFFSSEQLFVCAVVKLC